MGGKGLTFLKINDGPSCNVGSDGSILSWSTFAKTLDLPRI